MNKFMFWKKKTNAAESLAQHLANLMGTNVAGFIPEPPNDKVDLDTELFVRNNATIAALVIITGLVKGNQEQQALILRSIKAGDLNAKSFESYLFRIIAEELRNNRAISIQALERKIPEYSQVVYGERANKKSLEGYFFEWSQILSFEPTEEHIAKAIEKRQNWAKRNGLDVET